MEKEEAERKLHAEESSYLANWRRHWRNVFFSSESSISGVVFLSHVGL